MLAAFGARAAGLQRGARLPTARPARSSRPFVDNTVVYLHRALREGREILFEGAQGTFLDLDHGTYPYVTSSNTTAGGACTGSGVPPHRMDRVLGVMKAYTTRVGEGPFPTENEAFSDMLHGMGREFGATTGRARRCGWFDAVATRFAAMVNGIDEIAVTNLDGLDTLERIQICTHYQPGRRAPRSAALRLPPAARVRAGVRGAARLADAHARGANLARAAGARPRLLERIAELSEARLSIASVGPESRADDRALSEPRAAP